MERRMVRSLAIAAGVLMFAGCIQVGTTEHRVVFNDNGSGEALLRLIDIRSDETSDSAVAHDYKVMMDSFQGDAVKDFEQTGRKVLSKQFMVRSDTLVAEIRYSFTERGVIEGLRVTKDEMYIVVQQEREVVKTNGKVQSWMKNAVRIVWPRDERRLMYVVRERSLPPSISLASYYLRNAHH